MLQKSSFKGIFIFGSLLMLLTTSALLANGSTATTPTTKPEASKPAKGAAQPPDRVERIMERGYVISMAESEMVLRQMINKSGGEQVSGDYRIVYLVDPPRGWYAVNNGGLAWRAPAANETVHLEAAIFDTLTGQMLPITPTLDVVDSNGNVVQSQRLTFIWHPLVNHYGANYSIPNAGTYTLRVRADAPDFWRHNKQLGNRFAAPVNVDFPNVQLAPMAVPPEER